MSTVASHTEVFLLEKVAPELLSKRGKVSVLFIYFIWTLVAVYGFYNCKIEFTFDFFLTDTELPVYKYKEAQAEYFSDSGLPLNIFTNNTSLDFYSTESQLQMLRYADSFARCQSCEKTWFIPGSFLFWYMPFRDWIDQENCEFVQAHDIFTKTIDPGSFKNCLKKWITTDVVG